MPLPRPGLTTIRRLAVGALVLNVVLVVTGGAVRLTGSGLGCPTWPRCTSGSLTTTAALGVHGSIEFGNRLLGVVLELVGIALLAAVCWTRLGVPRSWRWLALVQAAVVPVQAAVGGVLVLTHLNPYVRAVHFLISFPITLAAAALLRLVVDRPGPRTRLVSSRLRLVTGALLGVAAAVLVAGALVSGTGPHGGDPGSPRLPFDPQQITQLHAALVYVLAGVAAGAALAARAGRAPRPVRRALAWLIALIAAQGVIGYVQYYTGVPALLVGLHMLGAALIFSTAAWVHLSTTGPAAPSTASLQSRRALADKPA